MENEQLPSTRKIGVKFGLIQGLISIAFFLMLDMTNQATGQGGQWGGLIILIAIIFFAQNEYKKQGDGFMNFGSGVTIGTYVTAVASVLSSIFTYLYISFVSTDFIEKIRETQIMQLEEQGLEDDEMERAMVLADSFTTPEALLFLSIFFGILFGVILSLILTAFTKRTRPENI